MYFIKNQNYFKQKKKKTYLPECDKLLNILHYTALFEQ